MKTIETITAFLEMPASTPALISQSAWAFGIAADLLPGKGINGADEYRFSGSEEAMEEWYNEFYCGGTPEAGNGFEFDILEQND